MYGGKAYLERRVDPGRQEPPSVNNRVPLPLASLAPVKHGPVAYRLPCAVLMSRADGCCGTDVWLGHVGTLRTLSVIGTYLKNERQDAGEIQVAVQQPLIRGR